MAVFTFIIILVALIVVHELGHFIVAKLSGMRVDEFGIGYPPRALSLGKKGETTYTLNWLPFGGFVKIFGEDSTEDEKDPRAFGARPRMLQALVLVAGIAMNILFAWVLLSVVLFLGTPRALTPEEAAKAPDAALGVAQVLPNSPADHAGLKEGDLIVRAATPSATFSGADAAAFTSFIANDASDAPITLSIQRAGKDKTLSVVPTSGVLSDAPSHMAIGVAVAPVGTLPVPLYEAPIQGAVLTWEVTKSTASGLAHFFVGIMTFSADLSQVSGPLGIASAVGTASHNGAAALLSLTAIISINLALINLLPVPALDGGRLLFVAIEAVLRRPLKPSIAAAVNTVGFGFLILLMVVITVHDVFRIFG